MQSRVPVTLVGLMLAVALGCSAPATPPSSEPTPERTPLYAPDDLTSTIPSVIGDHEVVFIGAWPLDMNHEEGRSREAWSESLLDLGKEPSDVTRARGEVRKRSYDVRTESGTALDIVATRVDGIDAVTLWDSLLAAAKASDSRIDTSYEWHDIAARHVMVWTSPSGRPQYLLPKGEVLFHVRVWDETQAPTIYDTIAALP